MRTRDAETRLQARFAEREIDLDASTPRQGFAALLEFYRKARASDVELESDGDMLLYQWGTHQWDEEPFFELSLTRQLICGDGGDDDTWQLALVYRYTPTDELDELGSGQSEWCAHPDACDELWAFVEESEAYGALADRAAAEVLLTHEPVG